jgi:hypothetical protein
VQQHTGYLVLLVVGSSIHQQPLHLGCCQWAGDGAGVDDRTKVFHPHFLTAFLTGMRSVEHKIFNQRIVLGQSRADTY